jgi:biopolymer transport protein ExbD
MKCLLSVSLTAALAVVAELAMSNILQSPPLQKGVSVQMAVTHNAVAMPDADNENAWIVAVTADGRLYFGTREVSPDRLMEEMKATPRTRGQKLYIKADARASFASVEKVLEVGRTAFFEAPVLLTSQSGSNGAGNMVPAPGNIVPPNGLEVQVGAPSNAEATVVQASRSEQISPRLTLDGTYVSDAALADTLRQMLSSRSEKIVLLKADGQLPFAQVVRVIDTCRSQGAKVFVDGPEV